VNRLRGRTRPYRLFVVLACVAVTSGCASFEGKGKPAAGSEIGHRVFTGYLPRSAAPNSLVLLPAPPAKGSAAFGLDEEVAKKSFASRDSARWKLAISDADLSFPHAAGIFSCVLGVPITEKDTPHLYTLLRRMLADARASTRSAKNHYKRTRPFVINKEPICTPERKKTLAKEGSYPSAHATIGWAWALILAEISPPQSNAILVRGRAYGRSRNICNVHWYSDVVEGRFMGAATVARLHADPAFRADLNAARAELVAVRAEGLQPLRDCKVEAAALAR
jgi:acid phosphatase (class A)